MKSSELTFVNMGGEELSPMDTGSDEADFPTFASVLEKTGNELETFTRTCTKESDQNRLKSVLLVLAFKELNDLMENQPIFSNQLRSILTRSPTLKTAKERMNDLIKSRKTARLKTLLGQANQDERVPEKTMENLMSDILDSNEVSNLNKIFSCDQLPDQTKREFWKAVYTDKLFKKLVVGWELVSQCTEETKAIMKFDIPEDEHPGLIERLADDIVRSKDINNRLIETDKEVGIKPIRKQKLTEAIRKLESFKTYCENGGRDIVSLRNKMQFDLLQILSIEVLVSDNRAKLNIIEQFTTSPILKVADLRDLSKSQQERLSDCLRGCTSFQDYKRNFRVKLSLSEKKELAVKYIIMKGGVDAANEPLVRQLLYKFKMDELFKQQVIWRDFVKFFDLIYNDEATKDYRTAMKQEDNDFDEVLDKLREELEELLYRHDVKSSLIEKVVKEILENGNLKAIEENNDFSINQQTQLPELIEKMKNYQNLKKLKWYPENLKSIVHFQVLNIIVHADTPKRNYADVIDLTNKIVEGKSIDEVSSGNLHIADVNILKEALTTSKLPELGEYMKYFGSHKENAAYEMKQALIPIQRKLKINYTVFRELQEKFIAEQGFDAVRTLKQLTQDQRGELIKFLTKDEKCVGFVETCKRIEAAEGMTNLKDEIERLSNRGNPKARKAIGKFSDVIYSAILDFYLLDEKIADKQYCEVQLSKVFEDESIGPALEELYESEAYKAFYKHYGFLVTMKLRTAEQSLKRFFDTQIKANIVSQEDGDDLFKEWKKINFQAGQFGELDTKISLKKLKPISDAVERSTQYKTLLNAMEACLVRGELIGRSNYSKTLDDLRYEIELWKFDKDALHELNDGFNALEMGALEKNTHLSDEEKKEIAKKVLKSEGFEKFLAAKHEMSEQLQKQLDDFKTALETLSNEKLEEEVREHREPIAPKPRPIKPTVKEPTGTHGTSPTKPGVKVPGGKVAPPPPPKDEEYMKLKATEAKVEWSNDKIFADFNIKPEDFKANTTPEYRAAHLKLIEGKIEQLVKVMWTKAESNTDIQLGVYIENKNAALEEIRQKLREGSTDFPGSLKAKPRERMVTEINLDENFKKIVGLTDFKKLIQ